MKAFLPVCILSMVLFSCTESKPDHTEELKSRISQLEKQLNESYKPGLGEFMSSIQLHHAKLWFAGENENWELAAFEVDELKETLEAISKYNTDRAEVKSLPMIMPAVDSLQKAVDQKNKAAFKSSFSLLTNTCNTCHQATNHGFNVITIPTTAPVSNQDFRGK